MGFIEQGFVNWTGKDPALGAGLTSLTTKGVVSDTDLSLEGTTVGADQTVAIQAVLDLALWGPMTIYWDVRATAAGLRVHPNTRIVCAPGCGAKLKDNANNALLSNANYDAAKNQPNWQTAPNFGTITRDANIEIIGGIWNGNGGNQAHHSDAEGWHVCLRFFNCINLTLDRVAVYTPRTFSVHLCNTESVLCRDMVIDCGASSIVNRDGLHFNGPNTKVRIRNLTARTWDDAIAINADDLEEQLSPPAPTVFGPFANYGSITDFTVDGLNLLGGDYGVRILSGLARIDGVTIRNVTGRCGGHLLLIDNYSEAPNVLRNAGPGNIGSIVVDNVNVSAIKPSTYKQAIIFGAATIDSLVMRNITLSYDEVGATWPPVWFGKSGAGVVCAINNLLVENFLLFGPTGTEATALPYTFYFGGTASVQRVTMNNVTVRRRSSKTQPFGALVTMANTANIVKLKLDDVDSVNLAGNAALQDTATISESNFSDSNIYALVRGGTQAGALVRRDSRDPNVYYIDAAPNVGGGHQSMFGGGLMEGADTEFSAIVKLPASLSNSANVAIGSRCGTWKYTADNVEGYQIVISASSVILGETDTGYGWTPHVTRNVALTTGAEYRMLLSCVGTAINAYIQRISDGQWLNTSEAWQDAKVAFASITDSTLTGRWSYVSVYGGTGGATKTARFRNLERTVL